MIKRRCPRCNGLFYLDSGTARCPHCGKCVQADDSAPKIDAFWQRELDNILSEFDISALSESFLDFLIRTGIEFPTWGKGDDNERIISNMP